MGVERDDLVMRVGVAPPKKKKERRQKQNNNRQSNKQTNKQTNRGIHRDMFFNLVNLRLLFVFPLFHRFSLDLHVAGFVERHPCLFCAENRTEDVLGLLQTPACHHYQTDIYVA